MFYSIRAELSWPIHPAQKYSSRTLANLTQMFSEGSVGKRYIIQSKLSSVCQKLVVSKDA